MAVQTEMAADGIYEIISNYQLINQHWGPDSLNPPYESSGEADRGQVISRQSVAAGCDAPEVLNLLKAFSMRQRSL